MVSIFTYRDERKLFTLAGAIIVAALIALVQIGAARAGRPSPIAVVVQSVAVFFESVTSAVVEPLRSSAAAILNLPRLAAENGTLRAQAHDLKLENRRLAEALSRVPDDTAIARANAREPAGVVATAVGYAPEDVARTMTVDRGSHSGVARDDAVVTDAGVVGRVSSVTPFASTVQLITDATSKLPAVVQRGRWWGIATGVPASDTVALEYISQDARLRPGDLVVTGEGRSFRAGYPIGRIAKIFRPEGALYQTAILTTEVRFGRLHGVLILPPPNRDVR